MNKILLATLLGMGLLITGCSSDPQVQPNTTMGQELLDLRASYEKGIITEREYRHAKDDILERYDQ